MERDFKEINGLSDEDLIAKYNHAYNVYMTLTKSACISQIESISNFEAAKAHVKLLKKELKNRRITITDDRSKVGKGYDTRKLLKKQSQAFNS